MLYDLVLAVRRFLAALDRAIELADALADQPDGWLHSVEGPE